MADSSESVRVRQFLSVLDDLLSNHERLAHAVHRQARRIAESLAKASAKNATRLVMAKTIAEMLGITANALGLPDQSLSNHQVAILAKSVELRELREAIVKLTAFVTKGPWALAFDLCAQLARRAGIQIDERLTDASNDRPDGADTSATISSERAIDNMAVRMCECGAQTIFTKCVTCERVAAADAMMDQAKPIHDAVLCAIGEITENGIPPRLDPTAAALLLATILDDLRDWYSWHEATYKVKFHEKRFPDPALQADEYESGRRVISEFAKQLPQAIEALRSPRIRAVKADGSAPTSLALGGVPRRRTKKT